MNLIVTRLLRWEILLRCTILVVTVPLKMVELLLLVYRWRLMNHVTVCTVCNTLIRWTILNTCRN